MKPSSRVAVTRSADIVVVGGGVIGLAIALEARRRYPDCGITVLEKEPSPGLHASGRNSGVLHAGFYYSAESLKAQLTRHGRDRLEAFCDEHSIPVRRCGKLVVARDETELSTLSELVRRGAANGVPLEEIDAEAAARIEPLARTHERALFSPTTASVDPRAVVHALGGAARRAGVRIRTGVRFVGRLRDGVGGGIRTSDGDIAAGFVINAAGVYADRMARAFGFAEHYRILPFKGVYLYATGRVSLRTHVYPVPDLRNPFLGVHFTVTSAGRTKIGPTAIPALWREHYSGLQNFSVREMVQIAGLEASLLVRNDFGFRELAARELPKYLRRNLVRRAAELVPGIRAADFTRWGEPGIRAQLVDLRKRRLEMDFVFEGDARSFHVLNAVSPAFTCCLAFAELALDRAEQLH